MTLIVRWVLKFFTITVTISSRKRRQPEPWDWEDRNLPILSRS